MESVWVGGYGCVWFENNDGHTPPLLLRTINRHGAPLTCLCRRSSSSPAETPSTRPWTKKWPEIPTCSSSARKSASTTVHTRSVRASFRSSQRPQLVLLTFSSHLSPTTSSLLVFYPLCVSLRSAEPLQPLRMPQHPPLQQVTKGLLDKWGEKRVIDTPITVSQPHPQRRLAVGKLSVI